jgi:hypothetical protein
LRACPGATYTRVFTGVGWLAACLLQVERGDCLGHICRCGSDIVPPARALVCVRCRSACCPVCAHVFEAASYCTRCAETLIEPTVAPAEVKAASPSRAKPTAPSDSSRGPEWIILVARDQGELFAHLERAFARDDKVQIIVDRRKDYRRNPPGVEERLRIHGAVVVRRTRRHAAPGARDS